MEAKLAATGQTNINEPDSNLTGASLKRGDKANIKAIEKVEKVLKDQDSAMTPALMAI